ncbi:MAG: hypothetical protein HY711_10910 [Candidatus Melainabacteria bacterium]|nr:hypothetical protein [Candidatus Melainabacteria bacterium]
MACNSKVAIVSLALVALPLMSPHLVRAQGQPGNEPPQPRDPAAIYRAAGAEEGQLAMIRQAIKNFEEAARTRAQSILGLMRDIRQLTLQPEPDEKTVLSKQDELNKLQSEMANERMKLTLKIRSLLRPEQKQRLVQLMQRGPAGAQEQQTGSSPEGSTK